MINMLFLVLLFSMYILIGYIITKLMGCFITLKEGNFYKIITIFSMSFIGSIIIFISDVVNISLALVAYILLMIVCYKDTFIKKLSVVIILYPIIVSVNIFSQLTLKISQSELEYKIFIIVKCLIIALIWEIIYRFIKDKVIYAKEYINNKTWILIDIISFASFALATSTVIFTTYTNEYQAFILMPTCLISNLGILFTIKLIIQSVKAQEANNIFKLQSKYYKTLEIEQKNTRKIRHDMNNHLQVISTYINANNFNKAKEYLENLSDVVNIITTKVFCNNSVINAVLNSKYTLIRENDIKSTISLSIDNISKINDIDLCSVFANTLDNAIEACKKINNHSKKCITLKARYDKGCFIYNIKNTKKNDILIDNERYITDKDEKKSHSWGIQNITDIVKKYKGEIEITYTDDEFSVLIIIPILYT